MGTVFRHGYNGQQRYTICDAHGPLQLIRSPFFNLKDSPCLPIVQVPRSRDLAIASLCPDDNRTTVAEKDTAAAAKAAVGRPKAAKGPPISCGWPPRLSRARQICLKIDSLPYNWLTIQLSRTHAQAVSLSVCRPHDVHSTVGCNGDQIHQSNRLGLVWIRSILATGAKMLVGYAYQPRAFCPHTVLAYQTTPTTAFKRTLSISAKYENEHH